MRVEGLGIRKKPGFQSNQGYRIFVFIRPPGLEAVMDFGRSPGANKGKRAVGFIGSPPDVGSLASLGPWCLGGWEVLTRLLRVEGFGNEPGSRQ